VAPAAASAAPEAPAPAAAAAPAAAVAATPPKRRRGLGAAGQVVGIIGFVLSLVLAFGALAGSFWLTGQIETLATTVDARIAEGQPKLETLSTKVVEIKATVDQVVALADTAAQATLPTDGLLAGLRDRLSGLSNRYTELRTSYTDLREKVTGALSSLQLLERVIPGFTVPQEPLDALAALDAKVQELDAAITGVLDTKFEGTPLRDAAALVSEKVGMVSSGLETAVTFIDDTSAKLVQARADITAAVAQLNTYIMIGGVLAMLLFLYIAFLHWVLFRTSRAVGRGA
jgi:methyl-accepting chemotaxis protein